MICARPLNQQICSSILRSSIASSLSFPAEPQSFAPTLSTGPGSSLSGLSLTVGQGKRERSQDNDYTARITRNCSPSERLMFSNHVNFGMPNRVEVPEHRPAAIAGQQVCNRLVDRRE